MAEEELKVGMLTKRSQQKKSIGPVNYKERVFVLTREKISYYEGNVNSRGKLKGAVNINAIKFVGPLDDRALNKPCSFQIAHKDYFLYCTARSQNERDDWLAKLQQICAVNSLADLYHSQIYSGRQWVCCGKTGKDAQGCKRLTKSYPTLPLPGIPQSKPINYHQTTINNIAVPVAPLKTIVSNYIPTNYNSHRKEESAPPPPPPRKNVEIMYTHKFEVFALYNFQPCEAGDIKLLQGKKYFVLDDSKPFWWKVRTDQGEIGYVPANYVKKLSDGKDNIDNMDWFQKDLTRLQAEKLLLAEKKEGCFVVRNSSQQGAVYTLSVTSSGNVVNGKFFVKHYHIRKSSDGMFYLGENHKQSSVVELIKYHQHDPGGLVSRLRTAPQAFNHSTVPLRVFHDLQYELNLQDLEFLDDLGSGQFGVVRLASFQNKQKVAVKMMKEGTMNEDSFIEEAEVMTKLNHQNLVQLYGVVTKQRPICIVTEYMEKGCLLQYIRDNRELIQQPCTLLDMCFQVCGAMKYLEENQLIHRDLAARNCLVGKNNVVKVSDFGLTRLVLDDEYTTSPGSKFPIKWASPEVLKFQKFSTKSDVWAFGVLMWELYSGGKMPYVAMSNSDVAARVIEGYKLDKPAYCTNDIYSIMTQIWAFDPIHRPTFELLYEQLYNLIDEMQS